MAFAKSFSFALFWTVALYFQDKIGRLDPLQIVTLGSVAELTILTCELPTGVVADNVSRRLSVLCGLVLVGIGFAIQGIWPLFAVMVVGMVLWGLGETFMSGAQEAWIADEMTSGGATPADVDHMFIRAGQSSQLGAIVGTWASVAIASLNLSFAPVASGATFVVLAAVFGPMMTERGFRPERGAGKVKSAHFVETAKSGWRLARSSATLIAILAAVLFIGLASEGLDRLSAKHLDGTFGLPPIEPLQPVVWFAILATTTMFCSMALLGWLRRSRHHRDPGATALWLTGANLALMFFVFGFAFAGNFWIAAAAFVAARVVRRSNDPLITAWINRKATSEVRATMLSLRGLCHGLGETFGGPAAGVVAKYVGLRAGMALSAGLVVPSVVALAKGWRLETAEQVEPEPV